MKMQRWSVPAFVVLAVLVVVGFAYLDSNEEKSENATGSQVVNLSGIEMSFPANWQIEKKAESEASLYIPDATSSFSNVSLEIEKCEDTGDFSCFGSGRTYAQEAVNGGDLYDLLSNDTSAYFGLDFGTDKPVLYRISADFGDYIYGEKDTSAIRSILATAKETN